MKWSHCLSIIIITAFSIILYIGTLNNGFVYDDRLTVVDNILIKDLRNLPKLFEKEYFELSGEMSFRPVVTMTYFIDYAFYGIHAWGYHLTNLLLNAINGVLIYLFLILLLKREAFPTNGIYPTTSDFNSQPFVVSLLFVAHPVLNEAINAISFREDLLSFLFYMITFILYIKLKSMASNLLAIRFTVYSLSCFTYSLALLSKEMTVTLPLIIYCYEWIFGCGKKERRAFLYNPYIIGYIIITLAYGYLRFFYFYNPAEEGILQWSFLERLLTIPWLILNYIKQAIFPISLSAEYIIYPVNSPFSFSFFIPFILIFSLLVLIFKVIKSKKYMAFGILFFIITLIPVYNIISIANPRADRYLYLPTIGFAIFLLNFKLIHRKLFVILLSFIILIYSIQTGIRNEVWRDEYSLWSDAVKKMPYSWRPHYNLGRAYSYYGKLEEAVQEYKTALKLKPDSLDAHINLGVVYVVQNNYDGALQQFEKALRLNPNNADIHTNTGYIYRRLGRMDEAINEYKEALNVNPDHIKAHYNLGLVYVSKGLIDKAKIEFETALKIKPDFLPARQALDST